MNNESMAPTNRNWPKLLSLIIGLIFGIIWLLIGILSVVVLKLDLIASVFSVIPGALILLVTLLAKKWSKAGAIIELAIASGYLSLSLSNWQNINIYGWLLIIFGLILPLTMAGVFLIIDWMGMKKNYEDE